MKYLLSKLNYTFDALEPYIDKKTMEIHYTKHHQAYLDKMNGVLERYQNLSDVSLEDLLQKYPDIDMNDTDKLLFKNNAGGFVNHGLFWQIMGPEKKIDEKLVSEIVTQFGSVEEFKTKFNTVAINHFGSGWAWLVGDENHKLKIYSLPNQDSPLSIGHTPILTLDLWEHAYYLKYQNKRPEYIENWWKVVKLI